MRLLMLLVVLTLSMPDGQAQSTWKDIGYKAPASYKVVDNTNRLVLEKFAGKQYCQLVIFPLEQAAGSAAETFQRHWNFFARNASQGVGDPETKESEVVEGWTYTFGAARGSYRGQMFAVTISSRYYQGHSYFVATVLSDKQWLEDAQSFMNSVQLTADAAGRLTTVAPPASPNGGQNKIPTRGPVTTRFDDGWVSTYVGPYVQVLKDDLEVWLFPTNDSLDKAGREANRYVEDKYWRYSVDRFFEVQNIEERSWQVTGSDKMFDAEVRNRQTGKVSFVSMRVVWNSGRAQVVLAFAPGKQRMYSSEFARFQPFEDMLAYNRFAPTASLLQGSWQSFESGTTGSYSIAGGFQGGNAKINLTDGFIFRKDGTYESKHSVTRNNGTMKRSYEGQYRLSGSIVQLTNRDKEDPGEMECWLEATEGGLALMMVNKRFAGQRYKLLRIE